MSKKSELKTSPGRASSDDEHLYRRQYSLDIRLSPIEREALRKEVWKSNFTSMAALARYKIFGGSENTIDLYFPKKQEEKLLDKQFLSEFIKQGINLNQIAKQLNSKPEFVNQEAKQILKELKKALAGIQEVKEDYFSQKKK